MSRNARSRRGLWLVSGLLLVSLVLASCGGKPAVATEAPAAGGQTGQTSTEPVNVRFVILGYSPNTPTLYQEAINDFEAANPNIKVTLENVGWDVAHEKLVGWIATGDTPDISVIGPKWIPELMRLDGLQPFDSYVDADFLSNFPKSLTDPLTFDGKLYSIPEALSTRLMYYRIDTLKAAGFNEPPKTWDEFVKVAEAVNNPPDMYGFSLQGSGDESVWYYTYFMLGAGGYFTDAQGNWAINQPANVEALQFEVDLANKYKVTPPDPTSISQETVQGLFTGGNAAMYWGPCWTLPAIKADLSPDVGLTDYPTKSGQPAPMYIQDSFALFKAAKHPAEAVQFLEFWSQDKYQIKFNQVEGLIPVTISASAAFSDDARLQRFVQSIPYSRSYAIKDGWETVNVSLREAIQAALLGKDPKQALDEAQAKIEAAGYK
jgi:multiple sugar transport system substrate-binding protein